MKIKGKIEMSIAHNGRLHARIKPGSGHRHFEVALGGKKWDVLGFAMRVQILAEAHRLLERVTEKLAEAEVPAPNRGRGFEIGCAACVRGYEALEGHDKFRRVVPCPKHRPLPPQRKKP